MKIKHNKKRNTAFVYEALIKEATVSIMKGDHERKERVISVIKKHFHPQSILTKDLECYKALYENQNLEPIISEKILREAKLQKRLIDPGHLFKAQTEVIHDVNKEVEPDVFNNFVPNYKTLATIDQIFNIKTDPKTQVILEGEIVNSMSQMSVAAANGDNVDNVLMKTFVEKFNNKYGEALLSEQKELLGYYISSFTDNSLSLKMFLNEEIARLKSALIDAMDAEIFQQDAAMTTKAKKIADTLDNYASQEISENVLLTVLRTQQLVQEIHNDGDDG